MTTKRSSLRAAVCLFFTLSLDLACPHLHANVTGDQPSDIDAKPSDVIFTLRTEPHPYFTRYATALGVLEFALTSHQVRL
jgi:hypothetical protein